MKEPIEPIVSVIMPVYNTELYIADAIESVLKQTFQDFELIIVNDGSTDSTADIISTFSDPRIKYFDLGRNCGRGLARNFAINKCEGKYIAICDADDISLPTRFEQQVSFLEANPEIDILGTQILHFSHKSIPKQMYHFPITCEEALSFYNRGIMGVAHASCMLRKHCFSNFKYEDEISYNVEDFELFLQFSRSYKISSLPYPLVLYRNSLSKVSFKKIRYHELYHNYAIYSAHSKLAKISRVSFEEWSKHKKKSFSHFLRSLYMYFKLKIKTKLRGIS